MTLREMQSAFAANIARLILWAYGEGLDLTFGEAFRTDEQQALYLKQGKSKAKRSRHQDRLAVDLNLFIEGRYQSKSEAYARLGRFWKDLHPQNRWGGDYVSMPDGNHFEMLP